MRRSALVVSALAAASAVTVVGVLGRTGSGASPAPLSATSADTTIGGLAAGGLYRAGVTALLRNAIARQPPALAVHLGTRTTRVRSEDLGLRIDLGSTVDRVFGSSRNGAGATRNVTPVVSIDRSALDRAVARLQSAADAPASDGDLHYDKGVLRAVSPRPGQRSDAKTIRSALLTQAARLTGSPSVTIAVQAVPPEVSVTALQPLLTRATTLLAQPPILTAGGRRMLVDRSLLGPQVTVVAVGTGAGHGLALGLRQAGRASFASRVAQRLAVSATEPQLSAPAAAPVLREQGSVSWRPRRAVVRVVAGGKPGQQVAPDAVLLALTSVLDNPARAAVPVPTLTAPPHTSDAAARTVNAVLGTFTTPFRCCQPRVHNITLIARTVDGTLIGPGQTFSLNGIVGQRTRAKGYVEAPFILDGELSKDVGGGVSQFATTTLNAAYFAGLRIDRHQAHSFYISRYPPGREATVNYPSIDLQWTNTSTAPVLVRATTLDTSLTVTLYGRDDGRTVQSTTGPRRSVPGKDFRITVTRVTTVPGRPATRDSMTTTYNKPPKGE